MEGLWACIKRSILTYSNFNSPYLQEFLDEAIWRRKYKMYPDRIDFLVQLNQFSDYQSSDYQQLLQNDSTSFNITVRQRKVQGDSRGAIR